jgi:esterase
MNRRALQHDGLTFSYLDSSIDAPALIALHAHWMEAQTFAPLADLLAPDWRLVALDQRGHGYSDHAHSYTRADYLGDLLALLDHLRLGNAVLLGNSLGGVNAYQFAALHPAKVTAIIIEDIGVVIADDTSFALAWSGTFPTREELEKVVGPRFLPYLRDSIRQVNRGWRLAFDASDMVKSQACINGDHWNDWLASRCPALLIRGKDSRVTKAEHLAEMAARRPNTQLRTLEGGHVVHADDPQLFVAAVREFLQSLPAESGPR